ncbi:MAG: aminopeptidase [Bdellovibrionota bacterium]|nr:MAG: aminopeptidase [Bdellovibrionota bacterium]
MTNPELLRRYAELIVQHGLNVQPSQYVNIGGEVCHRELAYLVAEESYKRGAAYVHIDLVEPRALCARIRLGSSESFPFVPAWITSKHDEMVHGHAAALSIVGMEDPSLYKDLDPKAVNTIRMAHYQARKRYYDEGIGRSKVHWCVAAGATTGWAARLLPNTDPEEALSRLWNEIFAVCRVDRDDCLAQWKQHNQALHRRAEALNELRIRYLDFRGPGTELRVGLSERARFKGGSERGPFNQDFEPNLPTEECFTTPDWRETTGQVSTTRPFLINGVLIEGLSVTFKNGEIVDFKARHGERTFREYISSDPGAIRLGEVALVGIDSPVYRSGLVFEEILFDENAACHIAIGSAYKFCLQDGPTATEEELRTLGCNESSVHTDMMISSDKVDVVAESWSGQRHELIRGGTFVGSLAA